MNLLEKHFDLAFAAPDGIQKLRELILTLAMRGKLVLQDPDDQPASELLKEIESEKQRLLKEGKIKQSKPLPKIKLEEVPYELPKSWEWVRLGDLFRVTSGNNLTKDKMKEGPFPVYGGNGVAGYHSEFNTEKPTIVIGRVGYYCGSIHLTPERAWITDNAFFTIYDEERLYQKFVIWLFKTINLQVDTSSTAQPVISGGKIYPIPIPIPPLAEQRRIVAKIDRLMARCDELKKLRAERNQRRITIHTAACDRLLTAKESNDFSTAWRFITQHFGELYSVKENVAELRKAILQLAVMGKLVPQDPNDEPASELLKAIEVEKQRLVKEGKIKPPKPLPEIKPEEVPFELPQGWKWVRFFTVNTVKSELVSAKDYPLEKQIAPDSIEKGSGCLLVHRTVEESGAKGPNNRFYKGQILYSKIRPSLNKAVIAPYSGLCSADMYPIETLIDTNFMLKVILSEVFLEQVRQAENRVKMPKLNLDSLGVFQIPIPPLAEQRRIVAKIDQLMALCEHLDRQIDAATSKQNTLLNAVMAQV